MSLTISTRASGDVTILDLSGRITLGDGTTVLRDQVKGAIAAGKKNLVLNMGGVSYVDSAGLGELVGCRASAGNAGATLKLTDLQKKITDLMTITKLHTVFDVYETEEAAVRSFAEDRSAAAS